MIWDTGSEINLISESFAKAANIRYDAAHGPTVGGSGGRDSRALGKVAGPVQSVLNGGTAFEAITHSPAAVTFFVMSGVEHLYDVLISTHIAQDFAAYADPLTSALVYRPHLLKGDLCTLANIPLSPTSRRSWTHTQAQTHFVCCTTHVVSDEGCGVSSDDVLEEFSDCSEYFEVTRKKKKWNRAAAALKMSCKSSSQVDSLAPPHKPSTNKRKGKREIRPGLNMMHKFAKEDSAQAQISHLGWSNAFFLLALMCTIGEVARINPKPLPQTGRTSPLVVLEGMWSRATCLTTVNSTLPDGTATAVMSDDMCKDEELGVIWGNHPQTSSSQRAAFRKAVSDKKDSAFVYDVSKLGTYKGAVGSYDIPLLHRYPTMAKR